MRTPRLKLAVIAVAAAFAGDAAAIDFLQTYRLARQNDATFAGARASLEAGLEKLPAGTGAAAAGDQRHGEHDLEQRRQQAT